MANQTRPVTCVTVGGNPAAGCTATCEEYHYEDYGSGAGGGWCRWFRFSATPGPGFAFVRFDWKRKLTRSDSPQIDYYNYTKSNNPFPPANAGTEYPDAIDAAEAKTIYGIDLAWSLIEIVDAVAVFERLPTDLLVNSSTIESPAQLVYDPATNLLVADF